VTQTSHNYVGPSLQALPAAVVFSSQLLHEKKSSASVNSESVDEIFKSVNTRANLMTLTLAHIEGWNHGGLND